MEKKEYNSAEREPFIAEMQELLNQLNQHVKYLRAANKTLKKIDADSDKMESYYFTEWIEDYDEFTSENHYDVLFQDPIYDALQEIHQEKIKLMKRIVSRLE